MEKRESYHENPQEKRGEYHKITGRNARRRNTEGKSSKRRVMCGDCIFMAFRGYDVFWEKLCLHPAASKIITDESEAETCPFYNAREYS